MQPTNLTQVQLIKSLNEFAHEAKVHLAAAKTQALSEEGCCLSLSLYNLKKAHEGPEAIEEYFAIYNLAATQLTPPIISDMINKARLTDEEKKVYIYP